MPHIFSGDGVDGIEDYRGGVLPSLTKVRVSTQKWKQM